MLKAIYFLPLITIISINISCSKKGGGNNARNNSDPINKPVVTDDVVFTPNLDYPSTSPECSIDSPELSEYLNQHPNIQVLPNHNCSVAFVFEALEPEIEVQLEDFSSIRKSTCYMYDIENTRYLAAKNVYERMTDPVKKEEFKNHLAIRKQELLNASINSSERGVFEIKIQQGNIDLHVVNIQKLVNNTVIKKGWFKSINVEYHENSKVDWLKYTSIQNLIATKDGILGKEDPQRNSTFWDGYFTVHGTKICHLEDTPHSEYLNETANTLKKEMNVSFIKQTIKMYSSPNQIIIDKAIF